MNTSEPNDPKSYTAHFDALYTWFGGIYDFLVRRATLYNAWVEALPYRSESFDTVVNTMAFSGYPRADDAMSEIRRVLKPGGRLVLMDAARPEDGNWRGRALAGFVVASGDILRDMAPIFVRHGFTFSREAIGGSGALYLYLAEKQ
jgi:SAM-dependent methyltransferase